MQPTTSLNAGQIRRRMAEIIERHGKWTAHRVRLHEGVYTTGLEEHHDVHSLRRVAQIVSDNAPVPMENLRVLDLGCLEGGYAIEMALNGARVVGIEGRAINIEKARFAQDILGLKNIEFIQDDVRNLSRARYGQFDVVLCLGILYHLDFPDVPDFVGRVSEVCGHFSVIDTTVSLFGGVSADWNGHTYRGHRWHEFSPETTEEEKARNAWGPIGNITSFALTRPSLFNLLKHVGFTSVYECHVPSDVGNYRDRLTLLARKGSLVTLRTQPDAGGVPVSDWPEKDERRIGADFNKEKAPRPRSRSWNLINRLRSLRK